MEVSLPSGFTVDRDSLPSLEISSYVKRVETRNGDTMVVLYFDKVESININLSKITMSINYFNDLHKNKRYNTNIFEKPEKTIIYFITDDQGRILSYCVRV